MQSGVENLLKIIINLSGLQMRQTIYVFWSAQREERNGAIKSCIWGTCWEPAWSVPAGPVPPKWCFFVQASNGMIQICLLTVSAIETWWRSPLYALAAFDCQQKTKSDKPLLRGYQLSYAYWDNTTLPLKALIFITSNEIYHSRPVAFCFKTNITIVDQQPLPRTRHVIYVVVFLFFFY